MPSTFERLVDNIRLNRLEGKVLCINKAVGEKAGSVTFTSDMDTCNHMVATGEDTVNVISVDVITLDDVLRGMALNLMKIDVEGFEMSVLRGGEETFKKESLKAVIMEFGWGERYGYNDNDILDTMSAWGFNTYTYDPFNRVLVESSGKNSLSGNVLFVRDLSFVNDRIKKAPTLMIHGVEF